MSIETGVTATPPTVSAIVLTATVGCHLLKISGYSQTRLVDNGERVESAKFKAAGHTWRIVFYPNGKYSMDHGAFSFYLKLVDRCSKGVDAEIQFSLLPPRGAESGTLPYSRPEIMHTFGRARGNKNKCGFNWLISRNEMETLQNKYVGEDDDSIIVRCNIKVVNKPAIHRLALNDLGLFCPCDDDTCKRLHKRSLAASGIAMEPQPCVGLGIKGGFKRLFSYFLA
uniref:MATH domain-containing protein n=1 Tax=Oryza punctata TaxID=4537 RepID=A0A0E0LJH8_ORYPU